MTSRTLLPLLTLALGAPAAAQGDFIPHTDPEGGAAFTRDGLTVVGSDLQGVWLWTELAGATWIGGETAVELSDDAGVVIGNRTGTDGFDGPALWTAAGGWQDLGGLPNQSPPGSSHGTAYDVSGDGSVVVGLGWYSNWKARGFRWDATNGMVELPQLGPGSSRASSVSGDGQWIGGFDEHSNGSRRAALWDAGLNETLLLARPENPDGYGEINDINSDGTVIVGSDIVGIEPGAGFLWKAGQGVVNFGPVKGVDISQNYNWAAAASEDGSVVVGGNWDLWDTTTYATIWTEHTGNMLLSEYLTGLGVQGLENYQLANATDISADGTRIFGWGVQFPFTFFWFEATIPAACNGWTTNFCITSPNSVGSGAVMGSNGHVSVASNSLQLTAGPVPDQPGVFFFGSATQAPKPAGDGFMCIGGGNKLYRLPASVAAGNVLSHTVDFSVLPAEGRILPGTTWHFQAWYRDPAAGGAGYNLSDGLSVTFCD